MSHAMYGTAPKVIETIELSPTEMLFWMYCPIKLPGTNYTIPQNLTHFWNLVSWAADDFRETRGTGALKDHYAYITAKTLWVTKDNPGNRPGWHSDGFMSNDINYIWSDSNPTLFWQPKNLVTFTQDHVVSLVEMDSVETDTVHHCTYPDKTLLRLDETVIHRVGTYDKAGLRTFVKVSFSTDRYDLEGNSKNHELNYDWPVRTRGDVRNSPQA